MKEFERIYRCATMLDAEFLRNECGIVLEELDPSETAACCQKTYIDLCAWIGEEHWMHPSVLQIEAYLQDVGTGDEKLLTHVTDPAERKYLFRLAQADQLNYDMRNGRTQMIRGADDRYMIARDAYAKLKQLGYCRRGQFFV